MKLLNKEMQTSNSVFVNKVQLNSVKNIIPLLSFLENRKKCPNFGKKVLIVSIFGLNFSFEMKF